MLPGRYPGLAPGTEGGDCDGFSSTGGATPEYVLARVRSDLCRLCHAGRELSSGRYRYPGFADELLRPAAARTSR